MNGISGFNTRTITLSRDQVIALTLPVGGKYLLAQDDPALVAQAQAAGFTTIYRKSGDGSLPANPAAWVDQLASDAPNADYLYYTNEVDPSPEWVSSTLAAMQHADAIGRKLVIANFATNRSAAQWQAAQPALSYAAAHGHLIGFHQYISLIQSEIDGGWAWEAVNGVKICTEFAYIRTITDGNHGWIGALSQEQYANFAHSYLPRFAADGVALLWFSLPDWPATNEGKSSGFGLWQAPTMLTALGNLNKEYTVTPPPVIPPIYPAGTLPVDAVVALPAGVNLRSAPSLSAVILRTMPLGERVTVYEQPSIAADGFTWIRVHPAAAPDGWSAQWIGGKDSFLPYAPPATPAEIIDVSEAQSEEKPINWPAVKAAGVTTVIIRATQGIAYVDSAFVTNITDALAAGLKVGVYHAVIGSDDGTAQAEHFLTTIAPYLSKLAYAPILDVELSNGVTPTALADNLFACVQAIERGMGGLPYLYTRASFWDESVGAQHDALFSQCPLWLAQYTTAAVPSPLPRGWSTWELWQYSDSGTVNGIKGAVDLSRAHP